MVRWEGIRPQLCPQANRLKTFSFGSAVMVMLDDWNDWLRAVAAHDAAKQQDVPPQRRTVDVLSTRPVRRRRRVQPEGQS